MTLGFIGSSSVTARDCEFLDKCFNAWLEYDQSPAGLVFDRGGYSTELFSTFCFNNSVDLEVIEYRPSRAFNTNLHLKKFASKCEHIMLFSSELIASSKFARGALIYYSRQNVPVSYFYGKRNSPYKGSYNKDIFRAIREKKSEKNT